MDPTVQPGQDPEAIRRAQLLAALLGQKPGIAPGTPQPATPGFVIPSPTDTNQPSAAVAQPMTTPKPPVAKPMATPTTAIEPGNQPPTPTFASEEEWNKANPPAAHTPYAEPDLKHRLLMGLFAGLQNFGRDPGAGERMLGSYLGDIQKNEEAEKHFPDTSAAAQHQRYMTAAQGAEQPLHIQQLQAQIADAQAQAKERQAKAAAEANPAPKTRLVQIADKDGHPVPALQNMKTGEITDQEGKPIPDAKLWEKPPAEKNLEKVTVLGPDGKPHVYGVNAKGEKVQDLGQAYEPPRETRQDKSVDQVERETRTNIRKAQETYRTAQNHATLLGNFVDEANKGNKVVAEALPLEGALAVTTSQGTKRINRTEVEQLAGAGNLFDRIMGKLGKLTAGQPYPDDLKADMKSLAKVLDESAYKQYSDTYDDEMGIAHGYGIDLSKKLPRLERGGRGGAGAQATGTFQHF